MHPLRTVVSSATVLTLASAHGYFQTPQGRQPGKAYAASCGEQAYSMMNSDINGNIQGLQQLVANQADYDPSKCNLWQCKGMKFADNTDNVQQYTVGEAVDLYFEIVAPHSGAANVSVIDTATNEVVGQELKIWSEYALTSETMKEEWQKFSVTLPQDLSGRCAQAGDCVIQMHWNAPPPVDQTYQSCIDFTV